MPSLKQLSCHIEHSNSKVPLQEYGGYYLDGEVGTYVAIPASVSPSSIPIPTPFAIRLTSTGYIAPGLAMFVFIDGVYQCNRNRDDLGWDMKELGARDGRKKNKGKEKEKNKEVTKAKGINFRVRQKEERRDDGTWVGRPWRFEEFRHVSSMPDIPDHALNQHFSQLGDIVVVVLRCIPRRDREDSPSDGSTTPESAMAPDFDIDAVREAISRLGDLSDGDNGEGYYGPHPHQQYYVPYPNGRTPYRNWEQFPWQQYGGSYNQYRGNSWGPAPPPPPPPPLHPHNPVYTYDEQYMPAYNVPPRPEHPAPAPIPQYHPCETCEHQNQPSGKPGQHSTRPGAQNHHCGRCGHHNLPIRNHHHFNANTIPQYSNGNWFQRPPGPVPMQPGNGPRGDVPYSNQHGPGGHSIVFNVNSPPHQGHDDHHHNAVDNGCYVISDGQRIHSGCEHCQNISRGRDDQNSKKKNGKTSKNKRRNSSKKGHQADDPWGTNGQDDGDDSDKESETKSSHWNNQDTGSDTNNQWGKGNEQSGQDNQASQENNWDSGDAWGGRQQTASQDNNWNNGDTWGDTQQTAEDNQKDQNDQEGWGADGDSGDLWGGQKDQPNSPGSTKSRTWKNVDAQQQEGWGNDNTASGGKQRSSPPAHSPLPTFYPSPTAFSDVADFVSPMHRDPRTDEPPLYTVPESIAKRQLLTHQVQVGGSSSYSHKIRVPQYLDTMEKPYARFIFKYRRKDVIENLFNVKIEREVEAERKILESMPRSQIVEQLLRVQGLMEDNPQAQRHSNDSRTHQSPARNTNQKDNWMNKRTSSRASRQRNRNHSKDRSRHATPADLTQRLENVSKGDDSRSRGQRTNGDPHTTAQVSSGPWLSGQGDTRGSGDPPGPSADPHVNQNANSGGGAGETQQWDSGGAQEQTYANDEGW